MSVMTVVQSHEEIIVGDELKKTLDSVDINGYVLILRADTKTDDTEAIHMFTVGNDLDELTDMLMAANQYLPTQIEES
jgi:hypothetical protein